MSKKKIVIPTEEEVAEYANQPGNPSDSAGGDAPNSEVPGRDVPGRDVPGRDVPEGAQAAGPGGAGEEGARSEAHEYKDKYLRAVAELANFRKRSEKDREDALRYANSGLVRALLGVMDDLERVIASGQEHPENTAAILDGVKMTAESFRKVLGEHNVEMIEAQDQPFDPAVHEAMMQQPSEHDVPTVLQVIQQGYKLHDRVIRPARVIVSKPKE